MSWAQAGNPGVSDWALPPYPQRHRHLLTKKKKKKKKIVVRCRLVLLLLSLMLVAKTTCDTASWTAPSLLARHLHHGRILKGFSLLKGEYDVIQRVISVQWLTTQKPCPGAGPWNNSGSGPPHVCALHSCYMHLADAYIPSYSPHTVANGLVGPWAFPSLPSLPSPHLTPPYAHSQGPQHAHG